MRDGKALLIASKEFASEHRWLSWWHLWSTLAAFFALTALATMDLPAVLRIASSVCAGMVCVRLFILYHDYQHGAILENSPLAAAIMTVYGMITLNPPSVWNRSHNHHHKHNSKSFGASIGSFPIMTTHDYASSTPNEQFAYAAARHPITITAGYLTVFLWGMTLRPLLQCPRKHWDSGAALVIHFSLMLYLLTLGADIMFLGMLLPLMVAMGMGAYLFYAQHNFPKADLQPRPEWSHVEAALHSSSFLVMDPVMNWFTGNIGYHHVHHLNARIPFYRLPEAMASLVELQSPGTITLHPRDVLACLRLKLWSPEAGRFVGFGALKQLQESPVA